MSFISKSICKLLSVNRNDNYFRISDVGVDLFLGSIYKVVKFFCTRDFNFCWFWLRRLFCEVTANKFYVLSDCCHFTISPFLAFNNHDSVPIFAIQFAWTPLISLCKPNNWLYHFLFSFVAQKIRATELTQHLFARPARHRSRKDKSCRDTFFYKKNDATQQLC